MSRKITELKNEVRELVQDHSGILDDAGYIGAVNDAVRIYSAVKPYKKTKSETGDGATYEWAVASDYYEDFSTVEKVDYPAAETDEREPPGQEVNVDYAVIKTATSTLKFRMLSATPATGDIVRYIYTTLHSVSDAASTLPSPISEQSVIYCAASMQCEKLAAYYQQVSDATIGADSVNYGTKPTDYSARAQRFAELSGLKDAMQKGLIASGIACVIEDFDPPPLFNPSGDYIIHTRNRR